MTMEVWFVTFSEKRADYEWQNIGREPHKIFHKRESAIDYVVKRVALACDKRSGKVIRHENCSGDGYFMYEWEETIDGETKRYRMQIPGYPYYVE